MAGDYEPIWDRAILSMTTFTLWKFRSWSFKFDLNRWDKTKIDLNVWEKPNINWWDKTKIDQNEWDKAKMKISMVEATMTMTVLIFDSPPTK